MTPGRSVLLYGYFAQAVGSVLSIAFSPLILRAVGAEAYGLVGLFVILQAWFQLLDAGLTPALTRESARFRGGATSGQALRDTLRGLEWFVALLAVPVVGAIWLAAAPIAAHWTRPETLGIGEIAGALQFMALILLLRWVSGIRRGVLAGFERHRTLHSIAIAVAVLRFPAILLYLSVVEPTPQAYFAYQLAVSFLEALTLWWLSRPLLPAVAPGPLGSCVASLRAIAAFAANHAFLSLIWIVATQTDKLILSRLLDLAQFGYLTLAVAAAAGVNLVVAPIGQLLMPALARQHAAGESDAMVATYRRYTRLVTVFASATAATMAAFGIPVMRAWTGDDAIANAVGPVLAWYAAGNALIAIGAMSYYLQYANGNLRLHTIGTLAFVGLLVPALFWTVPWLGMVGAAMTWTAAAALFLLIWVTLSHRWLLEGAHWRWLFGDVLRIAVPVALVAWGLAHWLPLPDQRAWLGAALAAVGLGLLAVAYVSSGLSPRTRKVAPS